MRHLWHTAGGAVWIALSVCGGGCGTWGTTAVTGCSTHDTVAVPWGPHVEATGGQIRMTWGIRHACGLEPVPTLSRAGDVVRLEVALEGMARRCPCESGVEARTPPLEPGAYDVEMSIMSQPDYATGEREHREAVTVR